LYQKQFVNNKVSLDNEFQNNDYSFNPTSTIKRCQKNNRKWN